MKSRKEIMDAIATLETACHCVETLRVASAESPQWMSDLADVLRWVVGLPGGDQLADLLGQYNDTLRTLGYDLSRWTCDDPSLRN